MKIIKQGVKPKRYAWMGVWVCLSCKSVFELTEGDAELVIKVEDNQFDGMSVTIVCPVCEEERSLYRGVTG